MDRRHIYVYTVLFIGCCALMMILGSPISVMGANPLKDLTKKTQEILNKTGDAIEETSDAIKKAVTGEENTGELPQWYVDYLNARKAAKAEDWATAITLFKKAIEQQPEPRKWTNKDGSKGGYFPYLYLGLTYLASGDVESARQSCELSKEKGIAPQEEVETCLAAVAQHAQNEQTTKAVPIATPAVSVMAAQESPAAPESFEINPPSGEVYAVIIGIGQYQDLRIPPLRFTVNDAQSFYEVLTDPNYGRVAKEHVKLLLNEEATVQNVKSAIGTWLKRETGEDDTVIIYYAGHGAPEGEDTYWVTYEANIDDLFATALNNNNIADMLNRIQAKRTITFLDSCYSAATVKRKNQTRDVKIEIPWEKFAGEGKVTISASNGTQLSLEIGAYQHGVFTYYLLEGLKGKADGAAGAARDGIVALDELWNYINLNVTEAARKQGNTQTPVFQGAVTAGIPLSYDLPYLKQLQQERLQTKQVKQAKLQELFEQKKIRADHFDCAFRMLDAGKSNGYLDGLLAGDISPETFGRLFECEHEE